MNQISSGFSVCCRSSSSPFRKNPFTRSSKPISFASSKLTTVFISKLHHHTINYPSPPPQIPGNHRVRKFSGEASQCNFGDDDFLKNEISDTKEDMGRAKGEVEIGTVSPLDAAKDLVDKALDDNEKAGDEFRDDIDWEYYDDMIVAFLEFVDAGGDSWWNPFMSHYRRMLTGEGNARFDILEEGEDECADEEYRKILASLRQMNVTSRLMRELLEAKSNSQ